MIMMTMMKIFKTKVWGPNLSKFGVQTCHCITDSDTHFSDTADISGPIRN